MDLESRVARLERQNRRLRALLTLVLIVALAPLLLSWTQEPKDLIAGTVNAKKIKAGEFILVNSKGWSTGRWSNEGPEERGTLALHGTEKRSKLTAEQWTISDVESDQELVRVHGTYGLMLSAWWLDGHRDYAMLSPGMLSMNNKAGSSFFGTRTLWVRDHRRDRAVYLDTHRARANPKPLDYHGSGVWVGPGLIHVKDEKRRMAIIGRWVTVEEDETVKIRSPASSLVLLDEKGTVIHKVPK